MTKSLLLLLAGLCICMPTHAQVNNWELIWSDEFNSTELDETIWNYETGTGVNGDFGTGQLDRATDRPENVDIETAVTGADGGALRITTRKEAYIDRQYTSGRINTTGKASWGPNHRIVARVWPKGVRTMGQGFAFWMMPDELPEGKKTLSWPQGGEIDIMEYVGSIPRHNLGSVHYAPEWNNNTWVAGNHEHQGGYYAFAEEQMADSPEWIMVDLGATYSIDSVLLNWENPAAVFAIQISSDGSNWSEVYTASEAVSGTVEISFSPVSTRFVRMHGTRRANEWGYSLFEFQVFEQGGSVNLANNKPASASSSQNNDLTPELAFDNNLTTRWGSALRNPEYQCCTPSSDTDPNVAANGWHEYGIDWYEDRMEFFLDDNVYHIHYFSDGDAFSKDGVMQEGVKIIDGKPILVSEYSNQFQEWHSFEHKMYVILSAGVGGSQNTYGGPIAAEANFPVDVFVDWVRVYSNGETFNPPPSISLTASGNKPFTDPASLELTAMASDRDGGIIEAVDFYNGEQLLATDDSSPYTYTWTDVAEGKYTLTAKATDDGGAVTTSNPLIITVKEREIINGIGDDKSQRLLGFPNPVKRIFFVQNLDMKFERLEIFNLVGNLVFKEIVDGKDETALDLSELDSGIYTIKFSGTSGIMVKKIIKE